MKIPYKEQTVVIAEIPHPDRLNFCCVKLKYRSQLKVNNPNVVTMTIKNEYHHSLVIQDAKACPFCGERFETVKEK